MEERSKDCNYVKNTLLGPPLVNLRKHFQGCPRRTVERVSSQFEATSALHAAVTFLTRI
jgi:hypothetical protein